MSGKKAGYRGGDISTPCWVPLSWIKEKEVEERENEWFDDSMYIDKNYEGIWVCHTQKAASKYGIVQGPFDLSNAIMVLKDFEGGYLYIRPNSNGETKKVLFLKG